MFRGPASSTLVTMNKTDVQGTLREMWETRPARPRQDRQVAGVASAIARRYDIDPTLVRIGFVVATFTGIGAALYIAGWLVLPEQPAEPAHPVRARSPRPILVIGLGIATAASIGSLFGGRFGGGGLVAALVVAGLLYLLHRSRSDRGLAAAHGAALGPAGAPAGGVSLVKTDGTTTTDALGQPVQTPPAWDPLGAAPFAWDLPEPSAPPPPPAPRQAPITSATLGLALLAGAVTAAILLMAGTFTLGNLPIVFSVMLAVLGLGLLVGSFLRIGRGLIPFALLLSIITWGVLAAPVDRWRSGEVGDLRAAPTTVAQLLPEYQRSAGEIDLDLRNLDLTVPAGATDPGPVRTKVSIGAGDVQIWVPDNADVTFDGSVGIGSVSFDDAVGPAQPPAPALPPGQERERPDRDGERGDRDGDRDGERGDAGPGAELNVANDLGADGVRSGRLLVIDVEAGTGNVEVHRG
jgi:phage shock protein PspC (stress-responsive transcriptional regulator)